ncbi:hypothetical protein Bbelb_425500 [Branchiostoma belcheri]|nr:hypothetical protein Bbelb_425500 [Branchiostoma belcheri]
MADHPETGVEVRVRRPPPQPTRGVVLSGKGGGEEGGVADQTKGREPCQDDWARTSISYYQQVCGLTSNSGPQDEEGDQQIEFIRRGMDYADRLHESGTTSKAKDYAFSIKDFAVCYKAWCLAYGISKTSGEKRGQKAGNKNGLLEREVTSLISLLNKGGHRELSSILQDQDGVTEYARPKGMAPMVAELINWLGKGDIGLTTCADSTAKNQQPSSSAASSIRVSRLVHDADGHIFKGISEVMEEEKEMYKDSVPHGSVPVKMHILEYHVVPCIQKWRFGQDFLGEQSLEQVHALFNNNGWTTCGIADTVARLRSTLTKNLIGVRGQPHRQMSDQCLKAACHYKHFCYKCYHAPKAYECPWDKLGMDLIGPLPTSGRGNRYIFSATDYFTKWVEAFPIRTKSAEEVAACIMKMYARHGAAKTIITDQGGDLHNKQESGSVLWTGYVAPDDYGITKVKSHFDGRRFTLTVHRLMYLLRSKTHDGFRDAPKAAALDKEWYSKTIEGLVEMFYRRSHQHKWKYNKNGMFRTDQQGTAGDGHLPPVLYVQMDNKAGECKNRWVLAYCCLLV